MRTHTSWTELDPQSSCSPAWSQDGHPSPLWPTRLIWTVPWDSDSPRHAKPTEGTHCTRARLSPEWFSVTPHLSVFSNLSLQSSFELANSSPPLGALPSLCKHGRWADKPLSLRLSCCLCSVLPSASPPAPGWEVPEDRRGAAGNEVLDSVDGTLTSESGSIHFSAHSHLRGEGSLLHSESQWHVYPPHHPAWRSSSLRKLPKGVSPSASSLDQPLEIIQKHWKYWKGFWL